jgi:hypothetical protein
MVLFLRTEGGQIHQRIYAQYGDNVLSCRVVYK